MAMTAARQPAARAGIAPGGNGPHPAADAPRELSFDGIRVGDRATFTVTVTEEMVDRFTALSGDRNPLHTDEAWASHSEYRGRIAHGMLVAGFFSRLVGMHLPGLHAVYLSQECRFLLPVRPGSEITVMGEVVQKSESSRTLKLKTQVLDAGRKLVVDGTAVVMVTAHHKGAQMVLDEMKLDLSGKVALVTGASKGIGAQTAILLARHKAAVAVNFRQGTDRAEAILEQIQSFGGTAMPVQADVSDPEQVKRMVAQVRERLGEIDILVNNAAPPTAPAAFRDTGWQKWHDDLEVMIHGTHNCVSAVLDGMVAKKSGRIINVISTYALGAPPAQLASYVTAKSGVTGLSRALASELGPLGITVNMVAPGMTDTDMISYLPQRYRDLIAHQTPLKRIATPADVAKTILFLASDGADFINGALIPVSGGLTMS